jgi:hypothetical protein
MKQLLVGILSACLCCSCAQLMLPENTVTEAMTASDLKTKIVLQNLSRFAVDHSAVPSDIDLKSGVFQTQHVVQGSLTLPYQNINTAAKSATLGPLSYTSQDNWTTTPVTDIDDLKRLRCLYIYAIAGSPGNYIDFRDSYCKDSIEGNDSSSTKPGKKADTEGWKKIPIKALPPQQNWLYWRTASQASDEIVPSSFEGCSQVGEAELCWTSRQALDSFVLAIAGATPNTVGITVSADKPSLIVTGAVPCTDLDKSGKCGVVVRPAAGPFLRLPGKSDSTGTSVPAIVTPQ